MMLRKCKCGLEAHTEEDLELFSINKQQKYGRRNICKACSAKASRLAAGYTEPKTSAPKGTYTTCAGQAIFSRYGLSEQAHKDLLDKVGHKCEICGVTGKMLVIDHNHVTGKIRGILCGKCNTGIGMLGDCSEGAANALKYLKAADLVV